MNLLDEVMPNEALRNRVRGLIDARQWPAAQAVLETLLAHQPGDFHVRLQLAQTMLHQGMFRASSSQLVRAAERPPDDMWDLIHLSQRLCFSGEIQAARNCLAHAELQAGPSLTHLMALAQLRWTLGEFSAAALLVERATALGLDAPDQFHFRATVLQATGDIDGSEDVLEASLRRWPAFGDAAVARSNLRKQSDASNHLDFLRQQRDLLQESAGVGSTTFALAEFESALFKELNDLGRHDEAWQALSHCNALMRSINVYDGAGEAAITEALVEISGLLASPAPAPAATPPGPVPIFIVGMPRSGTTLLDRMLSSHSQVVSAGEINDFLRQLHWVADVPPFGIPAMLEALRRSPKLDMGELGTRYLAQTRWRAGGRAYYIDKLPVNIQMVPFIRRALPHARILHMVRDPMDVCFSNFRAMFGNASAYSYDLQALAHYYGLYHRLVCHWHATLPGSMLDVSYEALTYRPVETLRLVLGYCGLEQEEACLHPERNATPVATPSSMQVREPIHTKAAGQWQPYARPLEPLRQWLQRLA